MGYTTLQRFKSKYFGNKNYNPKKYKPRSVYPKKTSKPKVSFAKRVNAVISRNVENKFSVPLNYNAPVLNWTAVSPTWFHYNFDGAFNLSQGVTQSTRVGNICKIKKWIIKGQIAPRFEVNPSSSTAINLRYSNQGICKIMLLKKANGDIPPFNLQYLFQSGNSYIDPTGSSFDQLLAINKDQYKVYWQRSFKLSPSQPNDNSSSTNLFWANNDFKCVANFGLDVTKYIGKNATLKYEDSNLNAQIPPSMKGLTLVAIWCPYVGQMVQTTANPLSYYQVTFSSYFSYEDA